MLQFLFQWPVFKILRIASPTESTKQGLSGLTDTEVAVASMGPAPGPLHIDSDGEFGVLVGLLTVAAGVSLTLACY